MDTTINNDLSIVIDNIKFTLLQKSDYKDRYKDVVQIQSENKLDSSDITKFWVYRSNSEIGFYRLCFTKEDHLFKGHLDYVQSTFIYIELQIFIISKLDIIPYIKFDNETQKKANCFCPNINETSCDTALSIIEDKNRFITDEEPFAELYKLQTVIRCGTIPYQANDSLVKKIINLFSKKLENTYELENFTLMKDNYNFVFENIIDITGGIYCINLKRKSQNDSLQTNYIKLYFVLANLMPTEKAYENLVPQNDAIELIKKRYNIYKNVINICNKDYHIIPILLTTKNALINKFGVYNKYIYAGIFICKLFDYTESESTDSQCSRNEKKDKQCSLYYSYIGSRYDDLFPFEKVIKELQDVCTNKKEYIPKELEGHIDDDEDDYYNYNRQRTSNVFDPTTVSSVKKKLSTFLQPDSGFSIKARDFGPQDSFNPDIEGLTNIEGLNDINNNYNQKIAFNKQIASNEQIAPVVDTKCSTNPLSWACKQFRKKFLTKKTGGKNKKLKTKNNKKIINNKKTIKKNKKTIKKLKIKKLKRQK